MRQFLEDYIKKLSQIVNPSSFQNQKNDPSQHALKKNYNLFLSQIKEQAVQNQQISYAISKMQLLLKQKLSFELEKIPKSIKKRGRPLKNSDAEKKLIEWIKCQGRKQFTKKQLKRQLQFYQGKALKTLSTPSLLRILQRGQLSQITVIVKHVGKEKQEILPHQMHVSNEEQDSNKSSQQMHDKSENILSDNKQFLRPFFKQQDSLLGMHYEFDDNQFEFIFEKRHYS